MFRDLLGKNLPSVCLFCALPLPPYPPRQPTLPRFVYSSFQLVHYSRWEWWEHKICSLENNNLIALATAGMARIPKYSPQRLKMKSHFWDPSTWTPHRTVPRIPGAPSMSLIIFPRLLSLRTDWRGRLPGSKLTVYLSQAFLHLATCMSQAGCLLGVWILHTVGCGAAASTYWMPLDTQSYGSQNVFKHYQMYSIETHWSHVTTHPPKQHPFWAFVGLENSPFLISGECWI
jgi:hypothetical protein